MTTFNTVEELMQALDASPHLLEGMRSRLLTRELLELPETVGRLALRIDQNAEQLTRLTERVDQLTERVDQLTERVDQLTERVDQLTERVDQLTERVDQLTERMDQLTERVGQLTERVGQLTETVDRLAASTDQRLQALERGMRRVQDDIGGLRNMMASNAVLKNATAIANSLGLRRTRNLSQDDLLDLVEGQDIADIPRNEWDSFLIADLIMEATGDTQTCYVAVEASYTADERDTRRAIRNAGYMTRFTGLPAHAIVVAARTDRRIDEMVETGEVHLYRMPERSLPAE